MRCGNCGIENPEAARVCRGCAQLLDGPVANVPSLPDGPYARRSRLLTRAIVIGTIGLLLLFCVLALSAIPRATSGRSGGPVGEPVIGLVENGRATDNQVRQADPAARPLREGFERAVRR